MTSIEWIYLLTIHDVENKDILKSHSVYNMTPFLHLRMLFTGQEDCGTVTRFQQPES